jgi:hypothetical protein
MDGSNLPIDHGAGIQDGRRAYGGVARFQYSIVVGCPHDRMVRSAEYFSSNILKIIFEK